MKGKIIFLTIILLMTFIVGYAQKNTKTSGNMKMSSIDQALMGMEKAAWNNLVNKKYDDFARMFAEDYQGIYDAEITTKASELAAVKKMTFKTADVSDIKVSHPASNVAIVTATVKSEMTMPDGKTFSDPMRSTSIYVKRGSQWLIVYHSHLPIRTM
jgi:ketosteroid isomerase-like protein